MTRLDDPELVQRQYATEAGLATRREAQTRFLEGENAFDAALAAVVEARPRRVLEVGCGMGQLAERIAASLPAADVVATDLSPRMVELAQARGLDARLADVQELPFADREFDCAVAGWMLYHVPDLDLALSELRRVLEDGGHLVAVTIGDEHLAEVWELVGSPRRERSFTREDGEEHLRRHFARVSRRDVDAALVFPDAAAVRAYVESTFFASAMERPVPDFEGPFRARTRSTVLVAER
jgi:SAM-dependent methyltransferase